MNELLQRMHHCGPDKKDKWSEVLKPPPKQDFLDKQFDLLGDFNLPKQGKNGGLGERGRTEDEKDSQENPAKELSPGNEYLVSR